MRRHLNTLFVTTDGAYLAAEGENLLVRVEQETRFRVPIHMIEGVVCFGRVSMSPHLMGLCAQRGVGVSFLSRRGRFLARVQGPASGNVLLRREQYRRADDLAFSALLARSFVEAKAANSRTVLLRAIRDHPNNPNNASIQESSDVLARILGQLEHEQNLDRVRGLEGQAACSYFSIFDHLIIAQKEGFRFHGRTRRPPTDCVNALLSFLYVLLVHDVASALESVGLDIQVGYLHRDRPGRPGLALDLVEELRPFLADRLALSLVNRRQVRSDGFVTEEAGGVVMGDATRKTVLVAYQERKQEEIKHPFLDEMITMGMLPHIQALLLARFFRGDLDGYPPFFWR